MTDNNIVLDAYASEWYANQLRIHEARAYTRKTPALMARTVFPVDAASNPYAKSLSFMTFDNIGEARIISDGALDAPMGDISGSETAYPVAMIATGFDMSNWEIEAARRLGVDVEARQVNAAFDRVDRLINKLAFSGDATRNIPGLINDADITSAAATNGGWIAGDDADKILEDIAVAYSAHQDACNGAHEITDILLPISEYNFCATKRIGTALEITVLQWLATRLPFLSSVANIHKVPEMKNAGLTGHTTDELMILYSKSDENMQLKIPQEIAFTPPMPLSLGQRTICYARCGGLHVHYPKSAYIVYGI